MSKIRVDEQAISQLIDVVEKFDTRLTNGLQRRDSTELDYQKSLEQGREIDRLKQELFHTDSWKNSVEGKAVQERAAELDAREIEITKKRKEIEDLAYNKGYVAGYVEITQKLGKQS